MYTHSKGIILRTVKYSESSMILDMYTHEVGRKSYIISGIRSKQAKTKAGVLQVMGLVEFISYSKETASLTRIKEIKADYLYHQIPFQVMRSCLGIFIMEISSKTIKETEANSSLFDFLRGSLLRLDQKKLQDLSLFHIQFLLGLSKHLGFAIQDNFSSELNMLSLNDGVFSSHDFGTNYTLDAESSLGLIQIIRKEKTRIPKTQRDRILDSLLLYYKYHIDDFGKIKSLDVLRSIFS